MKIASAARQQAERRGRWAEMLCVARLVLTGWQVLARRHAGLRGTGFGEIDLIARRAKILAFIEVKARSDRDLALLAVSPAQQQRIARSAEAFLVHRPYLAACTVRFDVMVVGGLIPEHIADAWRP